MRISIPLFILIFCSRAFACSEAMRLYEKECKAQDRYQKLTVEFGRDYSIKMTDLKGFKIPHAIGKATYFSSKNDFLNHSEITLTQNREWQIWNNGQDFIKDLSPVYLDFGVIAKLHKNLFSTKNIFNYSTDLGKLRTNNRETNPKLNLSCNDRILDDSLFNTLSDYDLKSSEGYPLLSLGNINACDEKNFSSADLYFYKGASVKSELVRWLNDLNDMLSRYENGATTLDISPYNYLADMRRWFLAIKPFNSGNEEVIAALNDYAISRLQLSPLTYSDDVSPIYLTVSGSREITANKVQEALSFFEGCLFETKTKLVSPECSSLK